MLKIQDNSLCFQVMFGPEVRVLHVFAFSLKCFSDQVADELASSRAEVEQLSACLSCLQQRTLQSRFVVCRIGWQSRSETQSILPNKASVTGCQERISEMQIAHAASEVWISVKHFSDEFLPLSYKY